MEKLTNIELSDIKVHTPLEQGDITAAAAGFQVKTQSYVHACILTILIIYKH